LTSGIAVDPPTLPVCTIDSSHNAGLVPSPDAGNVCVNAQVSTSEYEPPDRICVVMPVSILRVQNVGE
jgi:hypothetical protein